MDLASLESTLKRPSVHGFATSMMNLCYHVRTTMKNRRNHWRWNQVEDMEIIHWHGENEAWMFGTSSPWFQFLKTFLCEAIQELLPVNDAEKLNTEKNQKISHKI